MTKALEPNQHHYLCEKLGYRGGAELRSVERQFSDDGVQQDNNNYY